MASSGRTNDLEEVLRMLNEIDGAEDVEGLSDIDNSDDDWENLEDEETSRDVSDYDDDGEDDQPSAGQSSSGGQGTSTHPRVTTRRRRAEESVDTEAAVRPPPQRRRRSRPSYSWSQNETPITVQGFSGNPGVRARSLSLRATPEPLQCFLQVFPIVLIQEIVDYTNVNARNKLAGRRPTPSRRHQPTWNDVTLQEMKAFFGIIIAMGVIKIQNVKMYWQKRDWILDVPSFNEIMPRDRFLGIWRYLHFCDEANAPSTTDPSRDKLYKIRPLLNNLSESFLNAYQPNREISIDESLIPFKGRIKFREFIPSKRARFGIKVWVLAESTTGYVSKFQIYVGRDPRAQPEVGLATTVVHELVRSFEGMGYHLYMDNFFTSPELFESLQTRGVYACGTLRPNRFGFPSEITFPKRPRPRRGDSQWRMSGQLLAQSWFDNRAVYFLSAIHSPVYPSDYEGSRTVKRRGGRGNPSTDVPCPPLLKDYNSYMGGVDLNDQLRKYYSLIRRSPVWYRKVFSYLLELAIHNARVICESLLNPEERRRVDGMEFRASLIHSLVGETLVERAAPSMTQEERLLNVGDHLPVSVPGEKRDCRVCRRKAAAGQSSVSRSTIKCSKCNVHLCVREGKDCFVKWHKNEQYWL